MKAQYQAFKNLLSFGMKHTYIQNFLSSPMITEDEPGIVKLHYDLYPTSTIVIQQRKAFIQSLSIDFEREVINFVVLEYTLNARPISAQKNLSDEFDKLFSHIKHRFTMTLKQSFEEQEVAPRDKYFEARASCVMKKALLG